MTLCVVKELQFQPQRQIFKIFTSCTVEDEEGKETRLLEHFSLHQGELVGEVNCRRGSGRGPAPVILWGRHWVREREGETTNSARKGRHELKRLVEMSVMKEE